MSKSKYLDLAGLTAYDRKIKAWFKSGVVDIADEAINALFVTVAEGPADNEIWYTTNDNQLVPTDINMVYNVINHTYENGKGVIEFDSAINSIPNSAFYYCESLSSATIPNSVTSIGEHAFYRCTTLTSITIPNSVTSIGKWAFSDCSFLTSVVIPDSVTSIGDSAFPYCSSLTSINIPNSVTSIGKWAFERCFSLTSIVIGNSVTSIGDSAFYGCESLASITFEGTIEEWNTISKGDNWNISVPATYVQCTDGQVGI